MKKDDSIENFVGLANKHSFENAIRAGLDIKKGWSTSGLPDTRESHLQYKIIGWVDMNFEYALGLKFPGDPDCNDPSEIDGCRCTIIYNVD